MMPIEQFGIRVCTQCGTATAMDRACHQCGPPRRDLMPNTELRCPGWGCHLKGHCTLYLPSNAQGAGRMRWMEPPYVPETQHCPEMEPADLTPTLVELTEVLKRTIGRQNRN